MNRDIMNQAKIVAEFAVRPNIDVNLEINDRINFLATYLRDSGQRSYVLGVSGGVDSSTAGRLAQMSVEKLRSADYNAKFIAVRLPYGIQQDEDSAQMAIATIGADVVFTVNIKPAVDAAMEELSQSGVFRDKTAAQIDFIKGNIKARQRMIVQYAIAGAHQGIVIGTDHAAEALMGFFTKHGDGAADVLPLARLNKRQVRALAVALGFPEVLSQKPATANLEDLRPGLLDEDSFGTSYDHIDDYLEGKTIPVDDEAKILRQYTITKHKRELAVTPQ
jgi:NAD+ synthase